MRRLSVLLFTLNAFIASCPASVPAPGDPLIEIYDKIVAYQHQKVARVVARDPSLQPAGSLWETFLRLTIEREKIKARFLAEHPAVKAYIDPVGLSFYVIALPESQKEEVSQSKEWRDLGKRRDDAFVQMTLNKADDERLAKALKDDKADLEWAQLIEYIKPRFADAVVRYGNDELRNGLPYEGH